MRGCKRRTCSTNEVAAVSTGVFSALLCTTLAGQQPHAAASLPCANPPVLIQPRYSKPPPRPPSMARSVDTRQARQGRQAAAGRQQPAGSRNLARTVHARCSDSAPRARNIPLPRPAWAAKTGGSISPTRQWKTIALSAYNQSGARPAGTLQSRREQHPRACKKPPEAPRRPRPRGVATDRPQFTR